MATIDKPEARAETATTSHTATDWSEGPAAAAILATGCGAVILGLLTTLAEASTTLKDWLDFYSPVGPLSGKTTIAVAGWLVSWVILHIVLRESGRVSRAVLLVTGVLLGLGLLGTFPTFFDAFAAE